MSTLEALIQLKLPWVRAVAAALASAQHPVCGADDLVQDALLGLLGALPGHDAARAALWTYAEARITGAMVDARRALSPAPRSVQTKARAIAQAVQGLRQQLWRDPEGVEIAQALGISLAQYELWRTAVACLEPTWSLDYRYDTGEGEVEQSVFLADPDPGPAQQLEQADALRQRVAALAGAMARLPLRESEVLRLRYWEEQELKVIGAQLGLSESCISRLHTAALTRLRRWLITDDDWPHMVAQIAEQRAARVAQALARQNVLRTCGRRAYLRLWRAQHEGRKT